MRPRGVRRAKGALGPTLDLASRSARERVAIGSALDILMQVRRHPGPADRHFVVLQEQGHEREINDPACETPVMTRSWLLSEIPAGEPGGDFPVDVLAMARGDTRDGIEVAGAHGIEGDVTVPGRRFRKALVALNWMPVPARPR